jgi:3-oxoacyl-(acyl-carrier-protein) synthase
VFFGSSRGPLAGWTDPWPGRRGFDLLAATNSLPAEPAAAVSAVHGIGGPWQVTSTGCCSGLDALATAELWLQSGRIDRALVVAVDLPLVRPVLDAYARTGLLASTDAGGMAPAEAAAALCLEREGADDEPRLLGCHTATDPTAILGNGRDPGPLSRLISDAVALHGTPDLVIPHASGTAANLKLETQAITTALGEGFPQSRYKPQTGHGIGASGLLELVLALDGSFAPQITPKPHALLFKLASALGGRHSLACVSLAS